MKASLPKYKKYIENLKKTKTMLNKTIGRLLKMGTLLSTYGLLFTVLLQIICRFTPINTPPWTEEASRLFFIYASFLTFGSPVIIYLALAFIMNIRRHLRRRSSVWY